MTKETIIYNGKKTVSSTSGIGKVSHMQINEVRPHTYRIHKNHSKWLKDLNIRHDTIKLPKDKTAKTLLDINCISIFYGQYSKTTEIKANISGT